MSERRLGRIICERGLRGHREVLERGLHFARLGVVMGELREVGADARSPAALAPHAAHGEIADERPDLDRGLTVQVAPLLLRQHLVDHLERSGEARRG